MKTRLPVLVVAGLTLASVPLLFSTLLPTKSVAQSPAPITIPLVNQNGQISPGLLATICRTNSPDGRACVTISYPCDSNHNYIVECSDSLSVAATLWKPLPCAPHNEGCVTDTNFTTQRFYRIRQLPQPQKGIFAMLANDTGASANDSITMDPAVNGQVAETGTPNDLQGLLDVTNGIFTTLIPDIPSRSNFVITSNQLAGLARGMLPDGPHSLHLQKYDEVRNILWKTEVDFILDTRAPDTFITSHPSNPSFSTADPFTFTGTDDLTPTNQLRFECRHYLLPNPVPTNWSVCTSPLTLSNQVAGIHVFEVRAIDLAGNADSTPAAYSWTTIDITPPAISLNLDPRDDSPPAGDLATTNSIVRLIGRTEPNLTITLTNLSSATGPWMTVANGVGSFIFTNLSLSLGPNLFHAETADLAGNPAATNLTVTLLNSAPCLFHSSLTGWTVHVAQPSNLMTNGVPGSVIASNCAAILTEGDSFSVTLERIFTITNANTVLNFTYANLAFDTNTQQRIKDGFEAGLLDAAGNPLTFIIGENRDAFFNVSEGQPPALAAGVTNNGSMVSVDLSYLPAGTIAKLVFRLINNDIDHATTVRIEDVRFGTTPSTFSGSPSSSLPAPSFASIDFASLSDVTPSVVPDYGRTSFKEQNNRLSADLALRNIGNFPLGKPLVVAIAHLSNPTVRVLDPDGVTPDGLPYYDFTATVTNAAACVPPSPGGEGRGEGGPTLCPNQISLPRTLAFHNPNHIEFTYDLMVLGQLNRAPHFTSTPVTEALVGKPYTYTATAVDPDSDPLIFSLSVGPTNMTVNPNNGAILWNPTVGNLGSQDIRVKVEDGRGGSAEQHYVLSVINPPPNRPPFFTSTPVVVAYVKQPYAYDAEATDPDGDPITFTLTQSPTNAAINFTTGVISWLPAAKQLGTNQVTITALDGRGGLASQSYTVLVLPDPANHPPIIITQPVTNAVAGQIYSYDVDALDPDGDSLTYSFSASPPGMTVAVTNGLITWSPGTNNLGSNVVIVRVDDGHGGFDTQSFVINVAASNSPSTAEIHGTVFNDLNGDSVRNSKQRLYVPSIAPNTNSVLRYDGVTGAFLGVFASGDGLRFPTSLVFGPDGDLFVPSQQSYQILRYDGITGGFISSFTSGGNLVEVTLLAFGPDGNLFVTDGTITSGASHAVQRFNGKTHRC